MSKNIVICCDGTGNEIGRNISNVLKLYRVLEKSSEQRVFYNPGVGTIGQRSAWQRFYQKARGVFGLMTGNGLDDDVLSAYRYLASTYQDGDKVWLFGFSRGAYTVRALAAFIHTIGLLPIDQLNLSGYAFSAYKRSSSKSRGSAKRNGGRLADQPENDPALEEAWHFSRIAGAYPIRIEFLGVWDTVASVIVPRRDRILPDLQVLRFTRTNPSVRVFRHAIAIDERRRMFRLNRWKVPQVFRSNPYQPNSEVPQDVREVWFAGVHADVGGGYPEIESALSKYPLLWMIEAAEDRGLKTDESMVRHLCLGEARSRSFHKYVAPNPCGPVHKSLSGAWLILEWLPRKLKWREDSRLASVFGWYLPRGERRTVPEGALLHLSLIERMKGVSDYKPGNLPKEYEIEDHGRYLSNSEDIRK